MLTRVKREMYRKLFGVVPMSVEDIPALRSFFLTRESGRVWNSIQPLREAPRLP